MEEVNDIIKNYEEGENYTKLLKRYYENKENYTFKNPEVPIVLIALRTVKTPIRLDYEEDPE